MFADKELWVGDLPDKIRDWLTLDDRAQDRWALGEKVEAWSFFDEGHLRFVVRLSAAGLYRNRSVYFSHARAWPANEFRKGFDPGALIGRGDAFDIPWRDQRPLPRPEVRPEVVWKNVIKNERGAAVQFLAHLYEAVITGCPVVIAAPVDQFVMDSPLFQLIAFARAALPLELKRDCRIRIYTSQPELALRTLRCHLIAIPEDLAPEALAARRDAMLLDRSGLNLAGRKADAQYAEAVVDRVLALPGALFAFTERIGIAQTALPAATVPIIYNLAVASGDQAKMDSLLKFLYSTAPKRTETIPWEKVTSQAEWDQFSYKVLVDVAFAPGESPEEKALRLHARKALSRLQQLGGADEKIREWWDTLPNEHRPDELIDLWLNKLITPQLAAELQDGLSVPQIDRLLTSPGTAELLVVSEVKPSWADEFSSRIENLPKLVPLANLSRLWRQIVVDMLTTVLNSGQSAKELVSTLLALESPDPSIDMERYLLVAELLDRTGSPEGQRLIKQLGGRVHRREVRRELLQSTRINQQWNALRRFVPPTSWDDDTGDLLVALPELLTEFDVDRLVNLAPSYGRLPDAIQLELDRRMADAPTETGGRLVRKIAWLRWRLNTALNGVERRTCALTWLWIGSQRPMPHLEEWKQVMQDLAPKLTEGDIGGLPKGEGGRANWPRIALFGSVQLQDLGSLCEDLGVAAALAESIDPGKPPYEAVTAASRFASCRPELLRFLNSRHQNEGAISLQEAVFLHRNCGERTELARDTASRAVVGALPERWKDAKGAAEACYLASHPFFLQQVALWLCGYRQSFTRELAKWLNDYLPPSQNPLISDHQRLQALAKSFYGIGLHKLADFLWPNYTLLFESSRQGGTPKLAGSRGPKTHAVSQEGNPGVVRALCMGEHTAPCWQALSKEVKAFQGDDPRNHPLGRIASEIRQLDAPSLAGIDQNGWTTLHRVCMVPDNAPLLKCIDSFLEMAAVIRDDCTIGAVAAGVIALGTAWNFYEDTSWWEKLGVAMKACPRRSGMPEPRDRLEAAWPVLWRAMSGLHNGRAYVRSMQKSAEDTHLPNWTDRSTGQHSINTGGQR